MTGLLLLLPTAVILAAAGVVRVCRSSQSADSLIAAELEPGEDR